MHRRSNIKENGTLCFVCTNIRRLYVRLISVYVQPKLSRWAPEGSSSDTGPVTISAPMFCMATSPSWLRNTLSCFFFCYHRSAMRTANGIIRKIGIFFRWTFISVSEPFFTYCAPVNSKTNSFNLPVMVVRDRCNWVSPFYVRFCKCMLSLIYTLTYGHYVCKLNHYKYYIKQYKFMLSQQNL